MATNAPDEPEGGQHLVFGQKNFYYLIVCS